MKNYLTIMFYVLLALLLTVSCADSNTVGDVGDKDDDLPPVERHSVALIAFESEVAATEESADVELRLELQYEKEYVAVQELSLRCYAEGESDVIVAESHATTTDGFRYVAHIEGLLAGDYELQVVAKYTSEGESLTETIATRTITIVLKEAEPDPEPDPTPAKEATLTYAEAAEAEAVAGYGSPRTYKNSYGDWVICAYNTGKAIQLNDGKVAYIGTPTFAEKITSLTITTTENYTDKVYICGEAGTSSESQVLLTAKCSDRSTTIDLSELSVSKFYLRAAACIRIESLKLLYGGEGGTTPEPDPEPTPDPDPTPEPDPTPDPNPDDTTGLSWAELPVITDANNDGRIDSDNTLYYAHHLCAGNEKNAQGTGKARNFTVCYSGKHHCPVWVAAPRHSMYEQKNASRTDAYGRDPKIPSSIQYSSKSTGGGCNKGHMLGSAERLSSAATNRQVFYYTNIAPQYSSSFNTGGGAWNNLEDHIDDLVCRDTLYIVVGCYFDNFSKNGASASPKTISFGGRGDVSCPTMFYYALLRTKKGSTGKRVQDCSAAELQCAAFAICHKMPKGHKPQAADMMSISELERLTGFTYFNNVPNAPKDTYNPSDWL